VRLLEINGGNRVSIIIAYVPTHLRAFDAPRGQRNCKVRIARETERERGRERERERIGGDRGGTVNWIGDFSRGRHSPSERPGSLCLVSGSLQSARPHSSRECSAARCTCAVRLLSFPIVTQHARRRSQERILPDREIQRMDLREIALRSATFRACVPRALPSSISGGDFGKVTRRDRDPSCLSSSQDSKSGITVG